MNYKGSLIGDLFIQEQGKDMISVTNFLINKGAAIFNEDAFNLGIFWKNVYAMLTLYYVNNYYITLEIVSKL